MEKQVRILAIVLFATLISFASGAAAAPNTFDANGGLCLIGEYNNTPQAIGTPMELWVDINGTCCETPTLAGLVTFDTENGTVRINLTDVDDDGVLDMYPYVATAVHVHFAGELDGIPHYNTGDPYLRRFEYQTFEYIVPIEPLQSEVVIEIDDFEAVGAIHLTVERERDYSNVSALADYLPVDPVQMQIVWPDASSYVELTLSEAGDLDGQYEGWCGDVDMRIQNGFVYDALLRSSYDNMTDPDSDLYGLFEQPENFDKVNYLLNNFWAGKMVAPLLGDCTPQSSCGTNVPPEELTKGDIQRAIWILIDDNLTQEGLGPWSQRRVNAILCDVNANGENFIPGCYEDTVFIAVPIDLETLEDEPIAQIITGQTQISTLGIPCLTECASDAWGDGLYGEEFDGILSGTYFNYDALCLPVEQDGCCIRGLNKSTTN